MTFVQTTWRRIIDTYAGRHEPENIEPLAEMFWRGALVTAAICIVVIVGYGMWTFFRVVNVLSTPVTNTPVKPPSVLSRMQLKQVIERMKAHETMFEALKKNPTPAVDPSK